MADEAILVTTDLTKEFRGFLAVSSVDLRIRRGAIHAIIGPNGAGKTSVFNLLTGVLRPTSGRIEFNGRDITGLPSHRVARLGMVRSFQISSVFPHLSVLENVRVALQRKRGLDVAFWRPAGSLDVLNDEARQLLDSVGLEGVDDTLAVELPYGRKRLLEIATTLALDPELMLLDEPTQGMGHEDVGRITALVRKVAKDRTVVLVEHNLSVVQELSDVITVLQRGQVLAEGPYDEVSRDSRVIEAYMGGYHG